MIFVWEYRTVQVLPYRLSLKELINIPSHKSNLNFRAEKAPFQVYLKSKERLCEALSHVSLHKHTLKATGLTGFTDWLCSARSSSWMAVFLSFFRLTDLSTSSGGAPSASVHLKSTHMHSLTAYTRRHMLKKKLKRLPIHFHLGNLCCLVFSDHIVTFPVLWRPYPQILLPVVLSAPRLPIPATMHPAVQSPPCPTQQMVEEHMHAGK